MHASYTLLWNRWKLKPGLPCLIKEGPNPEVTMLAAKSLGPSPCPWRCT